MTTPLVDMTSAILLWPDQGSGIPDDTQTVDDMGRIRNVSIPRLVPFLPPAEKANGIVLLVCPGGGYGLIAWAAHVTRLAQRFNPLGIAVIGLAYRTRPPSTDVPSDALSDLHRALSIVADKADEWKIDPSRLVGLGFSAGANLLLQHVCSDEASLKRLALLCLWPFSKSAEEYSVKAAELSTFLCATEEDQTAPADFAQAIAARMKEAGGEARIKIYPRGDHLAFNFKKSIPEVDWTPELLDWLTDEGLLDVIP